MSMSSVSNSKWPERAQTVFTGLAQVSATHTDAIQLYGSSHTLITGNWLHDNSTGIMAPDTSDHDRDDAVVAEPVEQPQL